MTEPTNATETLRSLTFGTLLALTGAEALRERYEALRDGAYGPIDDPGDREALEAVGEGLRLIAATAAGDHPDTDGTIAWLRHRHGEAGKRIAPHLPPGQRPARGDERCSCGLPATVVYETARFGDVPACGHGGAA